MSLIEGFEVQKWMRERGRMREAEVVVVSWHAKCAGVALYSVQMFMFNVLIDPQLTLPSPLLCA